MKFKIFAMSLIGALLVTAIQLPDNRNVSVLCPQTKAILVPQTTHSYSYTYGTSYTETGSWNHIYTGYPAVKRGEYDTITYSVEYTHTLSGSLITQFKKEVQLELGYSFGTGREFSISKNSAPLEVGEYVKAYYAKTYNVTPVNQRDFKHTTGWRLIPGSGGEYEYVDYYETDTTTAYAKEAIFPQIKLEYYYVPQIADDSANSVYGNSGDKMSECVRIEIYEYMDGNYQLVYATDEVIDE